MKSRLLRAGCPIALGVAALGLSAPSHADAGDAAGDDDASLQAAPTRFAHRSPKHQHRLAVGTGFLLWLSSREQGIVDLEDQADVHSDPLLSIAFGSQLTPTSVIGVRFAYAAKPYFSDGEDHELWQLAAEARWQPEGELGPYVVGGAGGVAAVDGSGGISAWHLAPAVGGALGFDVSIGEPLTLGIELRALGALFRSETDSFGAERVDAGVEYSLSSWLGLSVIATLGVGTREPALDD